MRIVLATRDRPSATATSSRGCIAYGASPRATIALDRCARAHAWLAGRDYVTPEDVHAIAADVLRHRVLLELRGRGGGLGRPNEIVADAARKVPLP